MNNDFYFFPQSKCLLYENNCNCDPYHCQESHGYCDENYASSSHKYTFKYTLLKSITGTIKCCANIVIKFDGTTNNQTFSECIVLYLDNIQQHYQHNNSDPKKRLALVLRSKNQFFFSILPLKTKLSFILRRALLHGTRTKYAITTHILIVNL